MWEIFFDTNATDTLLHYDLNTFCNDTSRFYYFADLLGIYIWIRFSLWLSKTEMQKKNGYIPFYKRKNWTNNLDKDLSLFIPFFVKPLLS